MARTNHFFHRARLVCAGLAVALAAATLSAAAAQAASAPARAHGLLSVRLKLGGGSGPAAVATLGVPTTGLDTLQAGLNGHPVALPPVPGTGAQRVLNLAGLGRLRFGTNRLRVRLLMADGAVQAVTRAFTLSSHRDIAVAQALTPAHVGQPTILDASRSLLVPRTGGLATARWKLVRRPAGSHARLGSVTGARVTLRPDVPGHYLIALRVGAGSATGADLLNEAVTYPEPLVQFNTIAYDHSDPPIPGIQVEKSFYPDPGLGALQILVLGRDTLAPDSSHGIPDPNIGVPATADGFQKALSTLQQHLTTSDLVIITHPGQRVAPIPSSLFGTLQQILGTIGGSMAAQYQFGRGDCWSGRTDLCYGDTAKWSQLALDGGSFTVVGFKGLPVGQAWRETAAQNGTTDGRITGYFTEATGPGGGTANYTVVNGPDPYVPVQTCSSDKCDVQVGGSPYAPDSSVTNGMHVVVLDRTTLSLISNTTVTSPDGLNKALVTGTPPRVGHFSGSPSIDDQRLVIIQSVGDGTLSGAIPADLIEHINQFGGTPEYLWDAIHPSGGSSTRGCRYALIGAAADLPWQGTAAESSTDMRNGPDFGTSCQTPVNGQPTGQLDGILERGRDGLYTPVGGAAAGATDNSLYQILYSPGWYRPDQAWPMDDDIKGLKYVADKIGLCTPDRCYPDVRSAYTQDIDWASKGTLLSQLNPQTNPCDPSVCGPDFQALYSELMNEFDWLNQVHALIKDLQDPYIQATPVFDVQTVYDNLKNSYPVPDDHSVTMQWLRIFSSVMTIGQEVASGTGNPELAAVFGVASAAGTLATQLLIQPDGGQLNSVTAAAAKLGGQMMKQQQAYLEGTDLAETILDSTYQQLKAAGSKLWGWDRSTTPKVVSALDASATASAYSALLPVAYGGYNIKTSFYPSTSVNVYCNEWDFISNKPRDATPFAPSQPANRYSALTILDSSGGATRQAWTFANTSGFANNETASASMPNSTVTDYIYGPNATAAPTAPDSNSGAYQYQASWWRSTYNPPSHTICNTGSPSPPSYPWSTSFGSPPNNIPASPPP